MNKLVAYDADSDDESPKRSPVEPPPPKRASEPSPAYGTPQIELLNENNDDDFQIDSPPQNPPNTPQEMEENHQEILQIPPEPEGIEVDPQLAAKFERAFQQKAHGIDLNQQIQNSSDYKNPMSYEKLIKKFKIEEKGTNF